MKKKYAYFSLLFVSIFTFSCSLVDHPLPTTPDVYVAGYEKDISTGAHTAKYWKNGQEVKLMTDPYLVIPSAITIAGADVHVVGYSSVLNAASTARYWKNGVLTDFKKGLTPTIASDVAVSDSGDVYIAGGGSDSSGFGFATYWKNGEGVLLNDATGGWARKIFLSGNDVYVAGMTPFFSMGKVTTVAKYWKNGTAINLTDGSNNAFAFSMAVSGNDVHVVGYEQNGGNSIAKYWKNGVGVSLTSGPGFSEATDIAISGNDVYIVGRELVGTLTVAIAWKNGVRTNLANGFDATSIAVANNDVYVSGTGESHGSNAQYWKNGVAVRLSNGPNTTYPTSIFVTNP